MSKTDAPSKEGTGFISLAELPAIVARVYAEKTEGRTFDPLPSRRNFTEFRVYSRDELQRLLRVMFHIANPGQIKVQLGPPRAPRDLDDLADMLDSMAAKLAGPFQDSRAQDVAMHYLLQTLYIACVLEKEGDGPDPRKQMTFGTFCRNYIIANCTGQILGRPTPEPEELLALKAKLDRAAEISWSMLGEAPDGVSVLPTTREQMMLLMQVHTEVDGDPFAAELMRKELIAFRDREHRITCSDTEFSDALQRARAAVAAAKEQRALFKERLITALQAIGLPENATLQFQFGELDLSKLQNGTVMVGTLPDGSLALSVDPVEQHGILEGIAAALSNFFGVTPEDNRPRRFFDPGFARGHGDHDG